MNIARRECDGDFNSLATRCEQLQEEVARLKSRRGTMVERHNRTVARVAELKQMLRQLALRFYITEPDDIHYCLLCQTRWSKPHKESHAPGCLAAGEA